MTWTDPAIVRNIGWGHAPVLQVLPDGAILLTYRYSGPSVSCSLSTDCGDAFGPPVSLRSCTQEGGYSDMITDGDGKVHVVYYADDASKDPWISEVVLTQVPVLTSLRPASVWAGYAKNDIVLEVNGSSFLAGAHVFLSGGEKPATTFVSATQLALPLVAADMATPGVLMVSVRNPPPAGMPSTGALPLMVKAETTDPDVTISGADTAWHNAAVSLTFSATDGQSGIQKLQFQSPPTVAAWTDGADYTVPSSTQGSITVSARAVDWCNRVGTASATVNIDTTKPTTDALNAVSVRRYKTAQLTFLITEPTGLSPSARVVIKIRTANGGNTVKTIVVDDAAVNVTQTFRFKAIFRKGSYKWYVYATDLAGNMQPNADAASFAVR